MKGASLSVLLPALVGALLTAAWYLLVALLPTEQAFLLPTPDAIVTAAWVHRSVLCAATGTTLLGAALGFGCAIFVSFGLALLLASSRWVRVGLYPYLLILQMTPVIVLAPIILLWVGAGLPSVVLITFLLSFFPLVVNTTQGLVSTDPQLLELFRLYRARPWQELLLLRLPFGAPYFFTGLRIAATLAPIGAIVGDFYAGNAGGGEAGGLGFQALVFSAQFKMAALFATAALSCGLGFLFSATASLASFLVLHRWHGAEGSAQPPRRP